MKSKLSISATVWCMCSCVLLLLDSCTKTLELPDNKAPKKIVLMAEMVAGDTVYIRAGQSIPLSAGQNMDFSLISGLSLTIKDDATEVPVAGAEDSLSATLHTIPFTSGKVLQPGKTYTVSATHSSLGKASAVLKIPDAISVALLDTASVSYNSDSVLRFRIRINDDGSKENYYVLECLKQVMDVKGSFQYNGTWLPITGNETLYNELRASGSVRIKTDTVYTRSYIRNLVYTNDNNTENASGIGLNVTQNRILMKDNRFNGTGYITEVYVQKNNINSAAKGRLIFYVKSVTPEYYNYLRAYEQNSSAGTFTSLQQVQKLETNVVNGGGMLGGVSLVKFTFLFDSWEF